MKKKYWIYTGLTVLVAVVSGFLSGAKGDYIPYMEHFSWIIDGNDPWAFPGGGSTDNAYGPLYSFLAPLWLIHELAPKLLFITCWIIPLFFYLKRYKSSPHIIKPFLWYWLANPFFWLIIVSRGHMDALVGLSIWGGLFFSKRSILSGSLLALGFFCLNICL